MSDYKFAVNIYQDVFESAFSSYSKGLLVYAREFLSSKEEAEDIVGDVFVALWEKIDTVAAEAIKQYLFSSTRNRCLNYLSHLKVRSSYQEKILKDGNIICPSPNMFIENELRDFLNAAIDKLPPQKKKIFIMNKVENRSYAEIAKELNISVKTVDKHLELAFKMLRRYLPKDLYLLILLSHFIKEIS